jgi:alpha-tubulin suppressor-like RCC1 family protein
MHTLAVTSGGTVRCWGDNWQGQSTPPRAPGVVARLSAGLAHSAARDVEGKFTVWGLNQVGQSLPPAGLGIVADIACGGEHTIALLPDGSVRCWGAGTTSSDQYGQYGQSIVPTDLPAIRAVSGGRFHSVATTRDDRVRCWGAGSSTSGGYNYGQSRVPVDLRPTRMAHAGGYFTVAIHHDGRLTAWGQSSAVTAVTGILTGVYDDASAGFGHILARRLDGSVAAAGSNDSGECDVPPGLADVRAVAAGWTWSMALRADGSVVAWGAGAPAFPPDLPPVSKIAAGWLHAAVEISTDCDRDAVPDIIEIDDQDCNANGVHDSCDAAADILEDCNANGLGDSCEKQLAVALASGQLGPIGYQSGRTWTIPGAVRAQSPVTLRLTAHGDFGGLQEYVRVRVGAGFDELSLRNTADCGIGTTPSAATYSLTPEQFNAAITVAGELRISMEPSIAVDPAGCNGGTWIEATLDYVGARPADCNANGLLDGCEIAAGYSPDSNNNGVVDTCESLLLPCPADFDQDGDVNGADLGILLSAWGVTGQPGVDLNADGMISGADLGLLLSAWGPCK